MILKDLFSGLKNGNLTLFDAKRITKELTNNFNKGQLFDLISETYDYLLSETESHNIEEIYYFEVFNDIKDSDPIYFDYEDPKQNEILIELAEFKKADLQKFESRLKEFVDDNDNLFDLLKTKELFDYLIKKYNRLYDENIYQKEKFLPDEILYPEEITDTKHPFKDPKTLELFNYIVDNWNYDKNQKWADIYDLIKDLNDYEEPKQTNYKAYIIKRFGYTGKFQFGIMSKKNDIALYELLEEYSKR